jgi:hypothetical protein
LNRSSEDCVVFTAKSRKQKHLQRISWSESLLAVRLSTECSSIKELRYRLWSDLPQNALSTRRRHTSTILARFFPDKSIEQLPRGVCLAYQDEALLASIMGSLLLLAEPVLGVLFAERLWSLPPGVELAKDFFACYGKEVSPTNVKNIATYCADAARSLGWITRSRSKTYRTHQMVHLTSALLIFHHVYAPTPRSVELDQVFAEPVWKYLGFSQQDQVRAFCKNLERKGLIARYAHVDRLEQITTRYTLHELLERRVRV